MLSPEFLLRPTGGEGTTRREQGALDPRKHVLQKFGALEEPQEAKPTRSFWSEWWPVLLVLGLALSGLLYYWLRRRVPTQRAPGAVGREPTSFGQIRTEAEALLPLNHIVTLQNVQTGNYLYFRPAGGQMVGSVSGLILDATSRSATLPIAQWIVRDFDTYRGSIRLENAGVPGLYVRAAEAGDRVIWGPGQGKEHGDLRAFPSSSIVPGAPDGTVIIVPSDVLHDRGIARVTPESVEVLSSEPDGDLDNKDGIPAASRYSQWRVMDLGAAASNGAAVPTAREVSGVKDLPTTDQ